MSFLYPAALWALPLAAGPLLLHLLARRQAKPQPFSDLSLLRRALARARPRALLKQWLLLLARTLIVAALVLAYAAPVLEGSRGPAAGDGADVVLLLDSSYSMGYLEAGKTRFELAKRRGEEIIRSLGPADRVAVGVFSDRLETPQLSWQTPAQALGALSRARLTFRGTDFAPALRAAQELLSRQALRRRAVVLLSDGARHGWKEPVERSPGVTWLSLGWRGPSPNAYVASAQAALGSSAAHPKLAVRAQGLSPGVASVDVWLSGRRAQTEALRSAGGEQAASFDLPPPEDQSRPSWSGRASLRADALPADDDFFFSFRHPARPKVLVLYAAPDFFQAPSAGFFLRQLLGGSAQLLGLSADFARLDQLDSLPLSDYRAVLLCDFPPLGSAQLGRLRSFVERGGGLWVLPGSRSSGQAWESIDSILPAGIGALVEGDPPGLKPGPAADPALSRGFDLSTVELGRYRLLTPRRGAEVWLRSSTGYPLLVLGGLGRGRVAVWAASLDARWSNLALKPVFPAWLETVALDLCGVDDRNPTSSFQSLVGRPLSRQWSASQAAPERVHFRSPDGSLTTVYVRARRAEFAQTERPGLYEMTQDGAAPPTVFAVNVDRSGGESDLTALPSPPWRTLGEESTVADFRRAVLGRQARGALLGFCAAWVVVEMALSGATAAAAAAVLLLALNSPARAQPAAWRASTATADRFVWTQLRLGPDWNPYPTAPSELLEMLSTVTSVLSSPQPRVLSSLTDPGLFYSPMVVLAGREAPAPLSDPELRALRDYLSAGGLLWIEDASGGPPGSFDRWVRKTLSEALPEAPLAALPPDHVVYKTFFLLRRPGGRAGAEALEGVSWDGRTAVIYSRDDLLGVWVKDALGQPAYQCQPGGPAQCQDGRRLALNIVMYALTGSYKADAVHQPYLMQKMRMGEP